MEVAVQPEFQVIPPVSGPASSWNAALKIGFRFSFCYFTLYCFPFPLGALPYTDKSAEWYELGWHKIVPWVARHFLHLAQPITVFSNGSGDTTYDYVKVLCFLVIATASMIIWSALDRNRTNYSRLHQWLRFYLRLSLGSILLSYGGYKVIPSQFPPLWSGAICKPTVTPRPWASCGRSWALPSRTPSSLAGWKCWEGFCSLFRDWPRLERSSGLAPWPTSLS